MENRFNLMYFHLLNLVLDKMDWDTLDLEELLEECYEAEIIKIECDKDFWLEEAQASSPNPSFPLFNSLPCDHLFHFCN